MIRRVLNKIKRCCDKPYPLLLSDITDGKNSNGLRALLYYKTEPLFNKDIVTSYRHTNNWEIVELVRILNCYGFIVDVVDRSHSNFIPENKYALFIGLGVGNSGKHFAKYAKYLKNAVKVLYAAGPEPDLSDQLVRQRYDEFNLRNNLNAPYMRIIDKIDFNDFLKNLNYILAIGKPGDFCISTYKACKKPIKTFLPSSSPNLSFNSKWFKTRKKNKFLCLAGNGLICKGVDLLIEVFINNPDLELTICGPWEEALFEGYGKMITQSKNIKYEGFVSINSKKFAKICRTHSFTILNSAAEGIATSISTCMRCGLVPVVNHEVGIDVEDFGYLIDNSNGFIQGTIDAINLIKLENEYLYQKRVYKTLAASMEYTQANFTRTMIQSIGEIINETKIAK